VLPAASFLEKDGTFTNGERRVQRVRRAVAPLEARSRLEILLALMKATGFGQKFRSPSDVMDEIASLSPAMAGISYARSRRRLQWRCPTRHPARDPARESFPPAREALVRRVGASPSFGTALTLVTGRVLEHYNAGTMTRRTATRKSCPPTCSRSRRRRRRARIAHGERVRVKSAQGETTLRARSRTAWRPARSSPPSIPTRA